MSRFVIATTVLLAAFTAAPAAQAWGCKGHQVVALLAERHLTPAAKQMFLDLLQTHPIDPQLKRWCGGNTEAFADAATWADDVRQKGKDDGWHYIDVPRGAPRSAMSKACAPPHGCVTQAIREQAAVLKNKQADGETRVRALRYILHFVGDLHQPMHAITNGDRGGNCVPVRYFQSRPLAKSDKDAAEEYFQPNLHQIWDTQIVEADLQGRSPEAYAEFLDQAFRAEMSAWQKAGIHADDWAWESHEHAEETAYGALPKKVPIFPDVEMEDCASNNHFAQRMLHRHIVLGQAYQDEAGDVVEERLARAGYRLAMILNEAAP